MEIRKLDDGMNAGLDCHVLNAMLNLYDDWWHIRIDDERIAARQYFLQPINQNTVFFHSLGEKLGYLVDEGYYEAAVLSTYPRAFLRQIWKAASVRKFRFPTLLGALKY